MTQVERLKTFSEPSQEHWSHDIWDRALARRIDDLSSSYCHIDSIALMETAGRAVAKIAIERGAGKHPVIILCGQGNNGGDGLVTARTLHDLNVSISVFIVQEDHKNPSPLFSRQLSTLNAIGVKANIWSPGSLVALGCIRPIIIDAISGIGFHAPCSGPMLQALTEANNLKNSLVIAVDIPSGLAADEGNIDSAPLPAHDTVTFGCARPVHRLMPSAAHCGHVTVVDIGFPQKAIELAGSELPIHWREVDPQKITAIDPWSYLPKTAHKYDRGHVLVIGGSEGKIGAPILTAMAALRSGAGWCSIAVPRGNAPVDMPIPPELTVESFFDGNTIDALKLQAFLTNRKVQTVVVGPGWMTQHLDHDALQCLEAFTALGGTVVLDAGALHDIASMILKYKISFHGRAIMTPHPGEWTRMQNQINPPPLSVVGLKSTQDLCHKLGAHVMYKNSAPIVVPYNKDAKHHKQSAFVCISGNTALARAGSGDILAGVMAAHLAIGCSELFAMARSYTLLSRAAWMATQDVGEDAVLATDMIQRLGIAGRI